MPVLNMEIDKIRRFCIYKIIPGFMKLMNSSKHNFSGQKIFEETLIFTQDPVLAFEKFRIIRDGKKYPEGGETSRSMSYSDY